MGYRNEIYRAAPTGDGESSGSFCTPAPLQSWRDRGWRSLDGLPAATFSATRADPIHSSLFGLSYALHSCTECGAEKILLRIDSWRTDRYGETTDVPVMEFVFDAAAFSVPVRAVESLKILARPVPVTERVAMRAVNAAWFFLNQISAGQVPDCDRVLELHRIHPDMRRGESDGRDYKKRSGITGADDRIVDRFADQRLGRPEKNGTA